MDTTILSLIEKKQNILFHGPGGTGKTWQLQKLMKEKIKNTDVCASTGMAALNLSLEGYSVRTLHSWAGIGLGTGSVIKLTHNMKSDAKKRWRNTDILIVDEISMIGATLFSKLDGVAKRIRRCDKPFGGLQLIVSGDFLQLSPVNDEWIFTSKAWKQLNFTPVIFSEPKRYSDSSYFRLLQRARKGKLNKKDIKRLSARAEAYDNINSGKYTDCPICLEELKKEETIYLKCRHSFHDSCIKAWCKINSNCPMCRKYLEVIDIKPTKLYSTNRNVEKENLRELDKLEGKEFIYTSVTESLHKAKKCRFNKQHVTSLNKQIPEEIILKMGAQVMLRINLDIEAGLVNGSRGVVVDLHDLYVRVKFRHRTVSIEKQIWTKEDIQTEITTTRTQIPLILAWAFTIHKAQGTTLDYAVIDIGDSIFMQGQAYVALSRVRDLSGMFISNLNPTVIQANGEALEYVNTIEK